MNTEGIAGAAGRIEPFGLLLDDARASRMPQSLAVPKTAFEARETLYASDARSVGRGPRSPRAGAARVLILMLLGVLLGGALLAVTLFSPERGPSGVEPPLKPGAAIGSESGSAQLPNERGPSGPRIAERDAGLVRMGRPAPPGWDPGFDGKGSIRGRVLLPEGLDSPPALRIVAGPSRLLRGREHARRREIELPAGETEFVLKDMPLGGYDLRVEAQGLFSRAQSVLLLEGSRDPYITLAAHRNGFIDGHVRYESGLPAEGIEITLETLDGRREMKAATGASGEYIFKDVADGEYRIFFGPRGRPLVPIKELSFRAPSMQFTPQVVPDLLTIKLVVFDEDGQRVPDVPVDGYCTQGGQVHANTDDQGEAILRHVRPGDYRLSALVEDGRRGRLEVEFSLDGPREYFLHLRP